MGRKAGIYSRCSEEVETEPCLVKELIPFSCRKVWISCGNTCDEVVFEGADGSFGCIAAMIVRRHKLMYDIDSIKSILHRL